MKKSVHLYFRYISILLRSSMQYKASFLLMMAGRFLIALNSFLGVHFLFSGFQEIKGYSYGEILLCFSVIQLSFQVTECICNGFAGFAGIVRQGSLDRLLVRPQSLILQVLGSRFDLGRIGPMMSSFFMMAIGIHTSKVQWTLVRVITLIFMVFGGILLFTGLFMIGASICIFSVEESGAINILTYGAKEHGKYPFDIYGKDIMRFCTFVIPYTLVQYYPLQYLLGRSNQWRYVLYPFGTILFLAICYGIWRYALKHYQSAGS